MKKKHQPRGLLLTAAAVALLSAPLLSGCARASAQAKTTPDAPLDMPAPPPREAEPDDAETPTPVPLVAEPARNSAARPRQAPPREPPKSEPAKPEPPKPEPPKPETPPPPDTPKIEEPPKPPTTLQTTPATAEGVVERAIRASLRRATTDLNRIDYRALNADARTQYDTAKRFISQADGAIRSKNLVFAKNLADKAAALAAQLAGR
jgi:outer membrane biosynthesis protein TonB